MSQALASSYSSALPVKHMNVDTQGLYLCDTLSSPLDCNSQRKGQKHGHERCCRRHLIEDRTKAGTSWADLRMPCEHKTNENLEEVERGGEVHIVKMMWINVIVVFRWSAGSALPLPACPRHPRPCFIPYRYIWACVLASTRAISQNVTSHLFLRLSIPFQQTSNPSFSVYCAR